MDSALYDSADGYYCRGLAASDYATSARISPVFSFALARLVSEFVGRNSDELCSIVDIGCGDGSLLEAVASSVDPTTFGKCLFWGIDRASKPDSERFKFARDLSVIPDNQPLLIIANELFDALPFTRLVKRAGGLCELMVVDSGSGLEWEERPAPREFMDYFAVRGIELQDGQFADVSLQWSELFTRICGLSSRALIVVLDYGFPQSQLFDDRFRRFGTAAAYYRHRVSRDLLARPGEQDLTAHINFTDLMVAGETQGYSKLAMTRQAEFLLALGITEHPLFASTDAMTVDSLSDALKLREERESARRLVLPDGIGEDLRVLVMARGVPLNGWSFQRGLF